MCCGPNPPHYLLYLGRAYYLTGKYEKTIAALKRCLIWAPSLLAPHRTLAVIFSELGRKEEARAAAREGLKVSPDFSAKGFVNAVLPYKDRTRSEHALATLLQLGLPE